jgi:C4-dicarboxylate-specific signal transduction histidine kinase
MSMRGNGLGLNACKEILEFYEGGIKYVPTTGGNSFQVSLKLASWGRR